MPSREKGKHKPRHRTHTVKPELRHIMPPLPSAAPVPDANVKQTAETPVVESASSDVKEQEVAS